MNGREVTGLRNGPHDLSNPWTSVTINGKACCRFCKSDRHVCRTVTQAS